MEETLTVIRLGIKGKIHQPGRVDDRLRSPTQRNVKNWSPREMGLRWTAAGMLEAEKQFRKVIGYAQLPQLAVVIERRLQPSPAQHRHDPGGRDRSHCVTTTPGPPSPKFHGDRRSSPTCFFRWLSQWR